jgi:DnaJ-class molecular chaperone
MEDYYRLLDIHYEASIEELNDAYKNKILHFKSLPFLTENDKQKVKDLKKANIIFNNAEYKKTYDQYLNNKFKKEMMTFEDVSNSRKKNINIQNSNYIVDRIFGFTSNNTQSININHNELLRPKNAGLSSDNVPEFDKPLDFKESKDFLPYNFDS